MTPLLSTSPAARLTIGIVLTTPSVSVAKPWAPRNPSAAAAIAYVPAGAVRLNVPSALATTDAATELSALYKLMVIGLPAMTCPVTTGAEVGIPPTVRLAAPRDKILTRVLLPFETSAVHSN